MAESKNTGKKRGALTQYWEESGRPFVALCFVAPMILAYEAGLLWLGPQAMRNGADIWLRKLLEATGFTQYFLLPLLTCVILLGWHHLNRDRWQFRSSVLLGMTAESLVLAFLLIVVARAQSDLISLPATRSVALLAVSGGEMIGQWFAFLGAGIYEELLFRLMLFPLLATLLKAAGTPHRVSWVLAVILSSLVFAAAHYRVDLWIGQLHLVTTIGDTFEWRSFLFRFLAGVFFAVVFLARGFGVAAGTHAFYDIVVSMI